MSCISLNLSDHSGWAQNWESCQTSSYFSGDLPGVDKEISWPLGNDFQVGLNLYYWPQDMGPDYLNLSGGGGQVSGWMLIQT